MRRRSILGLAGLALAIAVLVMAVGRLSGPRARSAPESESAANPSASEPAPSAALAALPVAEKAEDVQQPPAESESADPTTTGVTSRKPREAVLRVHVTSRWTGKDLSQVAVVLRLEDDAPDVLLSSRRAVTNASGRAELLVPAATPALLVVSSRDATLGEASFDVPALAPGASHDVELVLPPDVVRWRAVDAASRAPIAGATIDAAPLGVTIRSDADGTFELPWSAVARIHAPGYGRRWLEPGPECGDLGRPCIVELVPSATLELHLVDGSGAPAGNVHVEVEPARHLGLPVLEDAWSADVGADGECAFELPPREPLSLDVRERTREARGWREQELLVLEPGEHRVLTRLRDGLVVEGVVVEAGGEPQAGLPIRLAPASASFAEEDLRQQEIPNVYQLLAESDLQGRFAFPHVPAGTWRLELPFQDFGHFSQRLASLPLVMHVGLEPVPPLTLTVWRGLYIRGQVLRPDGAPFRVVNPHPCWITASTTGFETRAHVRAGGVFEVGPLVPGTYRVEASGSVGFAASAPVTANAGDEGVALVLREGASVIGVVRDGDGAPAPSARVDLLGDGVPPVTVVADNVGVFRIGEIAPGTYDAVAQGTETGVARLRDLDLASGKNRDLLLQLEPESALLVRVEEKSRDLFVEVLLDGHSVAWARPFAAAALRLRVPPGRLEVRLCSGMPGRDPALLVKRSVDVAAGEQASVELTAEPAPVR